MVSRRSKINNRYQPTSGRIFTSPEIGIRKTIEIQ